MIAKIFMNSFEGLHRVRFDGIPSIPETYRPNNRSPGGLERGTSIGNYHGPHIVILEDTEWLILDDKDLVRFIGRVNLDETVTFNFHSEM